MAEKEDGTSQAARTGEKWNHHLSSVMSFAAKISVGDLQFIL